MLVRLLFASVSIRGLCHLSLFVPHTLFIGVLIVMLLLLYVILYVLVWDCCAEPLLCLRNDSANTC